MNKRVLISFAVLICSFAAGTRAEAQDTTNTSAEVSTKSSGFSPKQGFYLGVQYVNNFMDGDFDDSIYFASPSKLYDVPDVDNGMGFGIACGGRFDRGAFELSYQRTSHDTMSSFADMGESEATYNVVEFNFKFDLTRHRLRPFLQVGFGFPWMTIDNASTDGFSYYDETFFGFDLNAGAGLTYFITDRWALTGAVVYRWNWFVTVDGESIEDPLLENTVNCTLGISYTF